MDNTNTEYIKIEEDQIENIFKSCEYIAEGSYGIIKCFNNNYVIKRVTFIDTFESILPEIDIGYNFIHPSLCNIVDIIIHNEYIYYVMPKIATNFLDVCNNEGFFKDFHILKIAYKIAHGLNLLHKNNYLHGDLVPPNILIDSDYIQPKICDFGVARIPGTRINSFLCVNSFCPPEYQKDPNEWNMLDSTLQLKIDVWVFGVTIYRLLMRHYPSFIEIHESIPDYKKRLHSHFDRIKSHSLEITKFLKATLDPDVNTRFTMNEVCELLTSIMRFHKYNKNKLENCGYIRQVFDINSIELPLEWSNELENIFKLYEVSNIQKEFCVKILKKLYSLEKYRKRPIINVVEYAYFISEEYINDRTDTWYSILDRIKTDTYKQLLIDLSFSFY